ncbi:zinc-binding dehydrogenase [Nocardioides sp. CPCC 206347]|uniref:zinc-binding dehydrogenase n=1 Tax=unclassified Nocardioides TaxID=2615069 RepID=UPI003614F961
MTTGQKQPTDTMRAVVLDEAPAPPEGLVIRELPVPVPGVGEVLIRVRAFGLNRSELHTRIGLAHGVTFPRVLGIEATGEVAACPGGELPVGQQVVAMMGGMGRTFNGGYAEWVVVRVENTIAVTTGLDWATFGAVPEMLQTAYGSLTVGLDAQPGETLLVRGGTSSVGQAATILAKQRGMTVVSTTRSAAREQVLRDLGADHVVIDDGTIAHKVRALFPDGVDRALELVGAPTLLDTLATVRVHGVACMTGMLSNSWTLPDFYPTGDLPRGVWLGGYSGGAGDLPADVLQAWLDDAEAGRVQVPIGHVYEFDEIVQAHRDLEDGTYAGKLVVVT